MKKLFALAGAFILGVVVASSAGTVSAQFKSLVGQKVTGEYTVFVNGKKLAEKGAVIEGRTNAPVRAISDAINGNLSVDNKKKVINIITETNGGQSSTNETSSNKYIGDTKESLLKIKGNLENDTLKILKIERNEVQTEINSLKELEAKGTPVPVLAEKEKQLKQYDDDIAKYTEELRLVNEALAALEK